MIAALERPERIMEMIQGKGKDEDGRAWSGEEFRRARIGPAWSRLESWNRFLRRHGRLIVSVTLVGLVAALVLLITAPKRYCARGRLLFTVSAPPSDGPAPPGGKAAPRAGGTVWEWDMATQMTLLKTRSLAEATGKKLKMADKWELEDDAHGYVSRGVLAVQSWIKGTIETTYGKKITTQERESDIAGEIMDRVGATSDADGRTIEVSFVGNHPEKIVRILDALMSTFIEMDAERRRSHANEAQEWFLAKQHELQAAIAQREENLKKHARHEKPISVPGEQREEEGFEKLKALSHALVEAETRSIQTEALYRHLLENADLLENPPRGAGGEEIQKLRVKRGELIARRAALVRKFGEKWPDVAKADSELARVNEQIEAEKKNVLSSAKTACSLAKEEENRLRKAVEEQKQQMIAINRKALQSHGMEREIKASEKMADVLLASARQVRGGGEGDRRQVVIASPARLVGEEGTARKRVTAACVVASAVLAGIGLALIAEKCNRAVRTEDGAGEWKSRGGFYDKR
ncbi:MAG: hypothetical protein AB1696_22325 [Planctomycetota bacterium]